MIDYTNFQKALKNLEESWLEYQAIDYSKDSERLVLLKRMGLIKTYEMGYETLKKTLYRYLVDAGESDIPSLSKPLFTSANENGLLPSPMEQWIKYIDIRNSTAHEYGIEKIDELIELLPDFIDDAIGIYQIMTKQSWE